VFLGLSWGWGWVGSYIALPGVGVGRVCRYLLSGCVGAALPIPSPARCWKHLCCRHSHHVRLPTIRHGTLHALSLLYANANADAASYALYLTHYL